jgi:8-oxo-dGTP pyrophosphatase MutT (NUDIX family)
LDDGETAQGAAIRETFEETGYQIAVDRFVGSYRHVQFGDLRQVYCGHGFGGGALEKGPETVEVGWFHPTMLPSRMTGSTYTVIQDTLANHAEPIDRD